MTDPRDEVCEAAMFVLHEAELRGHRRCSLCHQSMRLCKAGDCSGRKLRNRLRRWRKWKRQRASSACPGCLQCEAGDLGANPIRHGPDWEESEVPG